MINIKKLFIIVSMTAVFSMSAFAASGFEFILNVPLGLSVGVPEIPKAFPKDFIKSGVGFDAGVTAQLGYMIGVTDGLGISILAELGYAHDTVSIAMNKSYVGTQEDAIFSQSFESIQVGLLPKVNIGAFAIGIGGGVKIPMASTITGKMGSMKGSYKLNMGDLNNIYSSSIIGYIKGTFDYSIFFTDKIAMNVGLYLGYDFMPKTANGGLGSSSGVTGVDGGTFDVGLQLGLKFGPKA